MTASTGADDYAGRGGREHIWKVPGPRRARTSPVARSRPGGVGVPPPSRRAPIGGTKSPCPGPRDQGGYRSSHGRFPHLVAKPNGAVAIVISGGRTPDTRRMTRRGPRSPRGWNSRRRSAFCSRNTACPSTSRAPYWAALADASDTIRLVVTSAAPRKGSHRARIGVIGFSGWGSFVASQLLTRYAAPSLPCAMADQELMLWMLVKPSASGPTRSSPWMT